MEIAVEVGLHGAVEMLFGEVLETRDVLLEGCVVHQDIDPAEGFDRFLDRRLACIGSVVLDLAPAILSLRSTSFWMICSRRAVSSPFSAKASNLWDLFMGHLMTTASGRRTGCVPRLKTRAR